MQIFLLHDCADWEVTYGGLVTDNDDLTAEMLQDEINKIKNHEDDEWQIEDVLIELPKEWGISHLRVEDVDI